MDRHKHRRRPMQTHRLGKTRPGEIELENKDPRWRRTVGVEGRAGRICTEAWSGPLLCSSSLYEEWQITHVEQNTHLLV